MTRQRIIIAGLILASAGIAAAQISWDLNADGGVDEAEFSALLFNGYDGDGSGTIDAGEITLVEADLAEDGVLSR